MENLKAEVVKWIDKFGIEDLAEDVANDDFLGRGSSRITYRFEHNKVEYVVKIPRSKDFADFDTESDSPYADGVLQSSGEIEAWGRTNDEDREILCPIVCHFYYGELPIIVMPLANMDYKSPGYQCAAAGKFYDCTRRKRTGCYGCYGCEHRLTFLEYLCKKMGVNVKAFMDKATVLADKLGLAIEDLVSNSGNVGIYNNKIVIVDYGLSYDY